MRKAPGPLVGAPAVLVQPISPPKKSLAGLHAEEESALAEEDPSDGAELSSEESLDLGEDDPRDEIHDRSEAYAHGTVHEPRMQPTSRPLPAVSSLPPMMKV